MRCERRRLPGGRTVPAAVSLRSAARYRQQWPSASPRRALRPQSARRPQFSRAALAPSARWAVTPQISRRRAGKVPSAPSSPRTTRYVLLSPACATCEPLPARYSTPSRIERCHAFLFWCFRRLTTLTTASHSHPCLAIPLTLALTADRHPHPRLVRWPHRPEQAPQQLGGRSSTGLDGRRRRRRRFDPVVPGREMGRVVQAR